MQFSTGRLSAVLGSTGSSRKLRLSNFKELILADGDDDDDCECLSEIDIGRKEPFPLFPLDKTDLDKLIIFNATNIIVRDLYEPHMGMVDKVLKSIDLFLIKSYD